nr:hypothetical protein [Bifidobacterium callimiconis]
MQQFSLRSLSGREFSYSAKVACGPDDEADAVGLAGFSEDVADVGFDGGYADAQALGDLVVGVALDDAGEDVVFPAGEIGEIIVPTIRGVAGIKAQIGGMTGQFTVHLPWLRIGVLMLVIIAAGLLASVIPARNAIRIQPAQGLTH